MPYENSTMTVPVPGHELSRLRAEIDSLKAERERLLRAAGAAAVFMVGLDAQTLSEPTFKLADFLADALNALPEETLRHAIDVVWGEAPHGGKQKDGATG
jgi:hypothetical protein